MRNPKHSSPAVSSRHNWPCRSQNHREPSSGSPCSPGTSASTSVLGLGGHWGRSLGCNTAWPQRGDATGRSDHPPANPGSPRQCPLGSSPTSLSLQCSQLTHTQRQAVIYNLFPPPLMLPQAYLLYEKKFTIQMLPFCPTAKILLFCLPGKSGNHGTNTILNGSVKILV